jgi:hypothetical protein
MTAQEIITKYRVYINPSNDEQIGIPDWKKIPSVELEAIKAAKPEILAILITTRNEKKEASRKAEEISKNAKIIGYIHIEGCDTGDTNQFLYDAEVTYTRTNKDEQLAKKLNRLICSDQYKSIRDSAKQIEAGIMSYWGVELNLEQTTTLISVAQKEIEEKIVKEKKIEVEAEAKKAIIFEAAKTTGTKQVLSSYGDDCNDPREECSYDQITVWAMPDGTTKTTRQHTW